MKKNITPLLFLLVLMLGCAGGNRFLVKVDAISSPKISNEKKYILLPGLKDVRPNDLQFQEYADYVVRALKSKGYIRVKEPDDASIAIFLSYGIGEPKEHLYSYSLPVWGKTGVSSSTTQGTMTALGNNVSYHGTTTYTPTYGITGYKSHTGSYTSFFRFLILDAVDFKVFKQSEKIKEVWKTTVTSTGTVGDLRRVFPVLVAAARPFIGRNTGHQIDLKVSEKDKAVLKIKGFTK